MPRYQYTDPHSRVLHGLQHGVNALVEREGEPLDAEGTVVAEHGDVITTRGKYEHAHMRLLDEVKDADPSTTKPPRAPRGSKSDRTQE